tara:strand:- start:4 stop:489 length:486 start_codon:yes stop_codon:yes gene_type:complete
MKQVKKDFVAQSIFDYEAMNDGEQGKLILEILEDQPVLMGFVTNLADDFSDAEHETIVDSIAILINAFIAAGIPVDMIPQEIVDDVIEEKVEGYNKEESENEEELIDSPLVYEDLQARAVIKCKFQADDDLSKQNFNMILNTVISIVERSVSYSMQKAQAK